MQVNKSEFGVPNRRLLLKAAAALGGAGSIGGVSAAFADEKDTPALIRMSRSYFFKTPGMDYFMAGAFGWGPAGGLDIGQGFYVVSKITDDDPDSWVKSFTEYGDMLVSQADEWKARGSSAWRRAAGESRLKAFSCYRAAWQFTTPGASFNNLYAKHVAAFAGSMRELDLPATFFDVPYKGKKLPGVFFQNPDKNAPVFIKIGGGDTCYQDLFLSCGRSWLQRGYSVCLVDLPGQGNTWVDGLYFEAEAEKPISAVIDLLIKRFGAKPGRMALLGVSLGGYFACRAAAYEPRLATAMASTPFNARVLAAAHAKTGRSMIEAPTSKAEARNNAIAYMKGGVTTTAEAKAKSETFVVDPTLVTMPFLSVLGTGEATDLHMMTDDWHANIRSEKKRLVKLGPETGGDSHCQVANRLRLVQECIGWTDEILKRA